MISLGAAEELIDFGGRIGPEAAREQLEGAVAIRNILERHRVAYLADEVGMGKTYVALGVIALFRHFNPSFRVLIIAPRANIQQKWHKELKNFVANNVRFPDLRVKAIHGTPARAVVLCHSLLELVHEAALDPDRDFIVRMSSFSFGLGEDTTVWRQKRDALVEHLPWLDRGDFDLRRKESFKDDYARGVCCALPRFDLVVVDEGHNLKHGFREGVAFRNRLMALAFGHPRGSVSDRHFRGYGPRADRTLFLSATPLENDYRQLWNQLDVFGFGEAFSALKDGELPDEEKRRVVENFLVRRVTAIRVGGKRLTKNVYRREWRRGGVDIHDEPLAVADERQRLIVALVQKKVAELLGAGRFNNSFQIGMLASFESFLETARVWKREEEEIPPNFDDPEQTDDREERLGIDVGSINRLARSYRKQFDQELPHPKMDAIVEALAKRFRTGRKALVFVRRIKSVTELQRKLEWHYDAYVRGRFQAELDPPLRSGFERIVAQYRAERLKTARHQRTETRAGEEEETDGSGTQFPEELDAGGNETFFAWFFRGEGGPPGILSGARLQRRLVAASSTFFEDNHVAALLGVRPEAVYQALTEYLGQREEAVREELAMRASTYLQPRQKLQRRNVFLAMQQSAVSFLAERNGRFREYAEMVRRERYSMPGLAPRRRIEDLSAEKWLGETTFWTELRNRAELRRRLWPMSEKADFRARFREEELRRELFSAMARLGHALVDLYILAINRIGSFALRAREGIGEEGAGLANAYLDLLEWQANTESREFRAFHEMAMASEHFDLLLDVNLPDLRNARLDGAAVELGRLLRAQQPVGGMFGEINHTLVRQFRMPGYPIILITTDLLQEGEDLHTFCSSVYHYGISWTASSMEQRIGRIDRVNSETERRLIRLSRAPEGEELLQVYFPHLRDTIEVLQVERVLERMNRFLRLMHEDLRQAEGEQKQVHVPSEILRIRRDVEQIREPLRTPFGVRHELLRGDQKRLAVSADWAENLARRFRALPGRLAGRLAIDWEGAAADNALLGTAEVVKSNESVPCKVSQRSRCKSGPRRCRYTLVATRETARATDPSKPRGQRPALGGSASVRAATRVKPEQAPKG